MALNPSVASTAITSSYTLLVGLEDKYGDVDYPMDFAVAYDTYARQGEVLGAINEGGNPAILANFLRSIPGDSPATVRAFAQAFANYWSEVCITPGSPAHGGTSVIEVTNNALDLVAAFEAAIRTSLTTQEMKPYFYHFINNLEAIAVSQIVWTITEAMPPSGSPASFPEGIS